MGRSDLTLPLPMGAEQIVLARQSGMKPALPLIVSYVGGTEWEGVHVYPKPGRVHDWAWTEGLRIAIVTGDGLDPTEAIKGCFWPESIHVVGYPTLIDVDLVAVSHVIEIEPEIRLWHQQPEPYFPQEAR